MAIFYRTDLSECETYKEFKDSIGNYCYYIVSGEREGFYDTEQYSKVFKGFDSRNSYLNHSEDCCVFLRDVCTYGLVAFTSPEFNVKNKTVTFFESEEKRNKGVRSNPTKMGKFFRKIAPYFNDKQIEFLVNYVVDYFTDSEYTHHVAKGYDIRKVYLSSPESGRDVGNYACINASCMRYNDWEIHPTEVYATDSWELHYLTNEDGDIGARALVCKDDDAYSYIYASCEHAGKTLEHKLKDLGFSDCDEVRYAFKGAKLLKIEGNGGLVAPYIDHNAEIKDCGDHLEITYGCSDYSFCSTGGYVEYVILKDCCGCGYECDEEQMISVDGELYCDDCVFLCDHYNEHVPGEPIYVYYSTCSSLSVCEDALEDMGAVYNEDEDEWQTKEWYEECTKEDEEDSEDEIEPNKKIAPGVKCIVTSGYMNFHFLPIGSVVKVLEEVREGVFECESTTSRINQLIKEKDLVIAV